MLTTMGIEAGYGYRSVVKNISLKVEQGEIVAIIGSNGAGKSTILLSIVGLARLFKGQIEFMSENITGFPPYKRVERGIVLVPEGRHTIDTMSIYENLLQGSFCRKDTTVVSKDITRMMEIFPILRERRRQLAGTLSGGERQTLAIARGLMAKPKLLLLDEPSLGLSPLLVTEIFHIIDNVHRAGITILLIEQNAYKALQLASQAYVIRAGELIYSGNVQELLGNEEIVKAYLGKRAERQKD